MSEEHKHRDTPEAVEPAGESQEVLATEVLAAEALATEVDVPGDAVPEKLEELEPSDSASDDESELSDDEAIDRAIGRLKIEGGSRLAEIGLSDDRLAVIDEAQAEQSIATILRDEDEYQMREFDMPVPGIFGTGVEPKDFDRKKTARWLLLVGVLLLALAGIIYYTFVYGKLEVPELIGKSLPEAVALIDETGLKLGEISEQDSASAPESTILDMKPKAGTQTKRGTKVDLTLSKAGTSAKVPNLAGMSEEKAREELLSRRLELEVVPTFSDAVQAGEVLAQLPLPNTQVPVAAKVTVLVSRGGLSTPVFAPRVIGLGAEAAQSLLAEQGIRASLVFASTTFGTVNEVVAQTPASRGLIEPGAPLLMVVSRVTSASDAAVPEVVGLDDGEAMRALQNAGFKPDINHIPSLEVEEGKVIAQNPPSSDVLLKKGDSVTLLVSSGAKKTARVPVLIGRSKQQAVEALTKAGFNPVLVGSDLDNDKGAPIVQQYPEKDTEYRIGMSVLLFASYTK